MSMENQGMSNWEQREIERRNRFDKEESKRENELRGEGDRRESKPGVEIQVHEHVYEEKKRCSSDDVFLGTVVSENSNTSIQKTKTPEVSKPVEEKVELAEPPSLNVICLIETPLDDFFPEPFYDCIDFIISTNWFSSYSIRFKAQVTESTKLFFEGLRKKKTEVINDFSDPFESIFANKADFTVEVTLYPSGYRIYAVTGKDYTCSLRYNDANNEIDVKLNTETIVSSKAILKEAINDGKVCPYCLALNNENAQFFNCSCGTKYSSSVQKQRRSPVYYILPEEDRFETITPQQRDRLFKWRSEGMLLIESVCEGENRLFENEDAAYTWLARIMELPVSETHFGVFDEKQVLLANSKLKRYKWQHKWVSYFFGIFTKRKYE